MNSRTVPGKRRRLVNLLYYRVIFSYRCGIKEETGQCHYSVIECEHNILGGPVVIVLATGSEARGFKPGRGQWIFSERKNPE